MNNVFYLRQVIVNDEHIEYSDWIDAAGKVFPEILEVYFRDLGIFSSRENAERMMTAHIDKTKDWCDLGFCYIIEEKPVDGGFCGKFDTVCTFKSLATYGSDGSPNAFMDLDDACEKVFHGHVGNLNFDVGDKVWELDGNVIRQGIVSQQPMKKSDSSAITGDYSDDSYMVYDSEWHSHPLVPYVFKLNCRMDSEYEKALSRRISDDFEN